MRSIVWDLGRKRCLLIIDPASRPPLGRVRLRKRHTVSFSPLRMTCSTFFRLKTNKKPSSERKVSRLVRDGRSLRAVEITQFLRKKCKIHSCALSSTRLRREPPLGGSLSYAVRTLCV